MFDLDNWTEIFNAIKRNTLRTFLTGFSISWGILMFIILLASSNGAKNGVMSTFGSRSVNSMQISGRATSMPYKGFSDNRKVKFDQKDNTLIDNRIPEREYISAYISAIVTAGFGNDYTKSQFVGIYPDYTKINGIKIKNNQGRFINEIDIRDQRKVAVINQRLKEILYKDENPVGKDLVVNKLHFTVIGVFEETAVINIAKAYLPLTTAQLLYKGGWGFESIAFTAKDLKTEKKNIQFINNLREKFGLLHQFNPKDERAVDISNQLNVYLQTMGIFNAINIFIWVIGLGTLFSGVVGISNIMLITVRERTRELGIRKALGANPSSILSSIILESVFVTSLFGYIGMFCGLGLSKLFDSFLVSNPEISSLAIFEHPSVDVSVAIGAMVVLIIAGVLAGYFPAKVALQIQPVEAMRVKE
jgi:putative ABC transport system permease protein